MSRTLVLPLAGFEVTLIGRFWVTTEDLKMIGKFYNDHRAQIDTKIIYTLDFKGNETTRRYTKAKIIDMIGFIKGQDKLSD